MRAVLISLSLAMAMFVVIPANAFVAGQPDEGGQGAYSRQDQPASRTSGDGRAEDFARDAGRGGQNAYRTGPGSFRFATPGGRYDRKQKEVFGNPTYGPDAPAGSGLFTTRNRDGSGGHRSRGGRVPNQGSGYNANGTRDNGQ